MMELRRATFGAAVLLAMGLSIIAAVATVIVQVVGDVSSIHLVAVVAVVGFTTSWVQTGRVQRAAEARATDVALSQSIG